MTEYPFKAAKKKAKEELVAACVLTREREEIEYLMVKRPETGTDV